MSTDFLPAETNSTENNEERVMNLFEWNPAFGPLGSSVIILGVGFGLYVIFQRLSVAQSQAMAWNLLWPKLILAVLLILALLDPSIKIVLSNSTVTPVDFRDVFPVLVLFILLVEWFQRRRFNMI